MGLLDNETIVVELGDKRGETVYRIEGVSTGLWDGTCVEVGGEVSEYVIILVDVNDTIGLDERDPYVADAVIVFTIDRVTVEEVDLETLTLGE